MNIRVRNAAMATQTQREHVELALEWLEHDKAVNAVGVLIRPRDRARAIEEAAVELEKAAALLRSTDWPTEDDYEAV